MLHLHFDPGLLPLQLLFVYFLKKFGLFFVPLYFGPGYLTLSIHLDNSRVDHINLVVHLVDGLTCQVHFSHFARLLDLHRWRELTTLFLVCQVHEPVSAPLIELSGRRGHEP